MAVNGCDGIVHDGDLVAADVSCHVCIEDLDAATPVAIRTWCFARKEIKLGQWQRRGFTGRVRLRECGKASCEECA